MLPLIFLGIAAIAAGAIVVVSIRVRRAGRALEQNTPAEPVLPQHVRRQPAAEVPHQPVDDTEAYDAVQWQAPNAEPDPLALDDPAWDEKKPAFVADPPPAPPPPVEPPERQYPERVLPSRFSRVISADEEQATPVGVASPEESDQPPPLPPLPPEPAPAEQVLAPPPPPPPPPAAPPPPTADTPMSPAAKLAAEAAATRAAGEPKSWLHLSPRRKKKAADEAEAEAAPEPAPAPAPLPAPFAAVEGPDTDEVELELELGLAPAPVEAIEEEVADLPISRSRVSKTGTGFDEKLDVFLKQLRSFSE